MFQSLIAPLEESKLGGCEVDAGGLEGGASPLFVRSATSFGGCGQGCPRVWRHGSCGGWRERRGLPVGAPGPVQARGGATISRMASPCMAA